MAPAVCAVPGPVPSLASPEAIHPASPRPARAARLLDLPGVLQPFPDRAFGPARVSVSPVSDSPHDSAGVRSRPPAPAPAPVDPRRVVGGGGRLPDGLPDR